MFGIFAKLCLISVVIFMFATIIIVGAEIMIKSEEEMEVKKNKKAKEIFSNIRVWTFIIFTTSILGMIITF